LLKLQRFLEVDIIGRLPQYRQEKADFELILKVYRFRGYAKGGCGGAAPSDAGT
jgi:hypothetical protein